MKIQRIDPAQAWERAYAGSALLVCAYDDGRCDDKMVAGAIAYPELERRLPELEKGREIILYCA